MHDVLQLLAMAGSPAPGGAAPASTTTSIMSFLPLIAIAAVFYFMVMRPQMQRQKKQVETVSSLKKGDKVLTNAGFYAYVHKPVEPGSDILQLKLGDTIVDCQRAAIASKVEPSGT